MVLFVGGLLAYVSTLAPAVLDGDAALFQYSSSVLGVTYPTGYPTYILLGRLWTTLIPIGSVAYRMNLFSAACAALALALLYQSLRRVLENRLAGLLAVLVFGAMPTYWRWATEAKIYTLHILLLSGILHLLARCAEQANQPIGRKNEAIKDLRSARGSLLAALLLGLALGNHSTTMLLLPGLFLFYWLNCRPLRSVDYASRILLIAVLPLALYLYVPLRAEWLLAREGSLVGLTVPVAVARGLVTEYYGSDLGGLVRYFTAADFTGGVVTNWSMVPGQLLSVYWPLVREDFTVWGAVLGLVGGVYFAAWRPRRFWPLFLMYLILIPFVLTYGQGEQSAFLLPSSLVLASFGGAAVAGGLRLIRRGAQRLNIKRHNLSACANASWVLDPHVGRLVEAALTMALVAVLAWPLIRQALHNLDWLTHKWDDAAFQYWSDVLAHPMEEGAGVLAHWGDLTSLWHLQHVEGLRTDLYGLYPPSEDVVVEWLTAGRDLYIAGPLQGWAADVQTRYQFLPWGRLVRLAPNNTDPLALLPDLSSAPGDAVFGDQARLLRIGYQARTASGGMIPVTLAWRTISEVQPDVLVSLRLATEDGSRIAQTDQALVSGWLPADSLAPDQVLLSFHRFKLPAGTLPGDYRLELALGDWPLIDGRPVLNLGQVTVTPADSSQPLDPWGEYKPLRDITFGGEIRLVGYDYSVTRAGQGKGFAARFLWQALHPPAGDYTLQVELVDADGKVWRDWRHVPAEGRAPTSTWAVGQPVRDQVALILPADAPPGEDTLLVQLAWLRPDGEQLSARRWILPAGETISLPGVQVVEKADRLFEPPPLPHVASADFGSRIQLIGYELPTAGLSPGDTLPLTLVWQSLTSDMRESYTVFVHLVGPDGIIHGQWDKEPGRRSKQPTTGWVTGEVVVDPIPVPLGHDAPSGTYRVLVGLYLAPDGPRLPLRDETGATTGDVLELTQIEVE